MLKKAFFLLSVVALAMFGLGVRCGAEVDQHHHHHRTDR